MRSLLAPALFLAAGSIAAPSLAHANQCDAGRALLSNHEIPAGCSIRAYVPPGTPLADVKVMVSRNGVEVDVTDQVTALGSMDLPIHYDAPDYSNQCQPLTHVDMLAYDAYDLTFTATVGETMQIGSVPYRTATVVVAATCPAPEDYLNGSNWIQCSAAVQDYQACDDQLCTPLANPQLHCDPSGSNDDWGSDDPWPGSDDEDDSGCAASTGGSIGAFAGPLGLLALAFVRYRRRRR